MVHCGPPGELEELRLWPNMGCMAGGGVSFLSFPLWLIPTSRVGGCPDTQGQPGGSLVAGGLILPPTHAATVRGSQLPQCT